MVPYNVKVSNITLSGTTPFLTIVSGAVRSLLIVELDAEGMGNSSAANEIGMYRVGTAGSGSATAVSPVPSPILAPNMTGTTPALAFSGAANASYATTQPTLSTLLHTIPLNANGQRYFWRANPNLNNAYPVPGGANAAGSVTFAPISGSSAVSLRVGFIEL
jgi:hypothetical protein